MVFRKANIEEAGEIRALYMSVIGKPFCAWDETYPGEIEINGDLAAGTLFVLEENGEIIGAISAIPENEMDRFDCWKIRSNVREFARVVIRPDYQHKGLSSRLVEGVTLEFRKWNVSAIHISVVKDNIPALKLYRKAGFDICGEADMYGLSFYLCEKIIE